MKTFNVDDIEINGEGYKLVRPKSTDYDTIETFGQRESGAAPDQSKDYVIELDDFSAGMGYNAKIGPGVYHYGLNIDSRYPFALLPGPKVTQCNGPNAFDDWGGVVDFAEFGGRLYALTSTGVVFIKLLSSDVFTGEFQDGLATKGEKFLISDVGGTNRLYVSYGVTQRYAYHTSGGGWTIAPDPGVSTPQLRFNDWVNQWWTVPLPDGTKSEGMQIVAVDATDPTHLWHVSASPDTPGNWAGPIKVGKGYPIRSLAASNRRVYAVCDDGVYEISETYSAANLTPYWGHNPSDQNGLCSTIYDGKVLASHYLGCDYVEIGQGRRIDYSSYAQPNVGLPNESPIFGPATAFSVENGWVVASYYNGIDSFICYGRLRQEQRIDGPGPFVWHGALVYLPGEKVQALKVSNVTGTPRMWVGTNRNVYWYSVPQASTPLQDWNANGSYRFAESGTLYGSEEVFGSITARKFITRADVQGDAFGRVTISGAEHTIGIDLSLRLEDGTSKHIGSSYASPLGIIYPNEDYIMGHRFSPQITLHAYATGTGPNTVQYVPILRAVRLVSGIITDQRRQAQYTIQLEGGENRTGSMRVEDADSVWEKLVLLQSLGPVVIKDKKGVERLGKIQAGIRKQLLTENRDRVDHEIAVIEVAYIEKAELPSTQIIQEQVGNKWEDGSIWASNSGDTTPGTILWQA